MGGKEGEMIEHIECDHTSGFCVWRPLQKIIKDCEAYMFMGRAGAVYLYKHCDTRRYLNVDEAGKCYVWRQGLCLRSGSCPKSRASASKVEGGIPLGDGALLKRPA